MKFVIHEDWRGWGIWESTPDWRRYNALAYFKTKKQAEEYEQQLLECGTL